MAGTNFYKSYNCLYGIHHILIKIAIPQPQKLEYYFEYHFYPVALNPYAADNGDPGPGVL